MNTSIVDADQALEDPAKDELPGSDLTKEKPESIGLLFIHGVGNQGAFEHMSTEVASLLCALECDSNVSNITVHNTTSQDCAFGAKSATWRAQDQAPVRIDFCVSGRRMQFHCREVWWSDLDDDNNLHNQIRFWIWGLGQWYNRRAIPTAERIKKLKEMGMEMPSPSKLRWIPQYCISWPTRLYLFLAGMYFFLVGITLGLVNAVLARFFAGRIPGPKLLSEYMGDVKLYQQTHWHRRSPPLSDINNPPRVCIRRRTVTQMVEMSMADHDRWYILAHSLGTIVAWNGLTETEHCLPNYLPEELWKRCKSKIGKQLEGSVPSLDEMLPGRPSWLQPRDSIDREKLFRRLQGLITYGSPLDKFAMLWPKIVPLTTLHPIAGENYDWINIYDPTDPVAGSVDAFGDNTINLGYRAHWLLVFSHLCYLKVRKNETEGLSNRLVEWFYTGGNFSNLTLTGKRWINRADEVKRKFLSCVMQGASFIVMIWLATYLTAEALVGASSALAKMMEKTNWEVAPLQGFLEVVLEFLASLEPSIVSVLLLTIALTLICGIIVRLRDNRDNQRSDNGQD